MRDKQYAKIVVLVLGVTRVIFGEDAFPSEDFVEEPEGTESGFLAPSSLLEEGWDVTAAAGLSLAQGNSDSLAYSLHALATYQDDRWEGLVGADYFYSDNEGVTGSDSLRIFGQGHRLLTNRFYLGAAGSFFRDDLADLDYRVDTSSVFGYHLIKNSQTKFSLEAGPGYTWEAQDGRFDSYGNIRFGQRFEHQLTGLSKIWQSANLAPQIDDFNNYNLIVEAGLDLLLTEQWAVRTGVRYIYDNTPATGRDRSDLTLTMGVVYSLGGFPSAAEEERSTLIPLLDESEEKSIGWTSSAALGVSLAKGNADSLQATLSFDSAYRTSINELFFNGVYNYGENSDETAVDALRLGTRYNRLLSEKTYVGVGGEFFRDDVARLSYRTNGSAYVGHYIVKNEKVSLAFEGGGGYLWEESAGVPNDFIILRAAERFSWVLGHRVTLKQDAAIDFEYENSDNYLLTVIAYLDIDITDSLSWRLAGTYIYNNEPEEELGNSDITLTSGIAVRF